MGKRKAKLPPRIFLAPTGHTKSKSPWVILPCIITKMDKYGRPKMLRVVYDNMELLERPADEEKPTVAIYMMERASEGNQL